MRDEAAETDVLTPAELSTEQLHLVTELFDKVLHFILNTPLSWRCIGPCLWDLESTSYAVDSYHTSFQQQASSLNGQKQSLLDRADVSVDCESWDLT